MQFLWNNESSRNSTDSIRFLTSSNALFPIQIKKVKIPIASQLLSKVSLIILHPIFVSGRIIMEMVPNTFHWIVWVHWKGFRTFLLWCSLSVGTPVSKFIFQRKRVLFIRNFVRIGICLLMFCYKTFVNNPSFYLVFINYKHTHY